MEILTYAFMLEGQLASLLINLKEDINMNNFTKETVKEALNFLLTEHEDNKGLLDTKYDNGYFEGYHDALVDVFNKLSIPTDEEYYN